MTTTWINVLAVADVPDDDVIGVSAGDKQLAIYNVEGEIFATDGICTHGHAQLCEGFLEGFEIECPLHQGRFDIRSGKALCTPLTQDIRAYPLKIEGGRVWIDLDEAQEGRL